MGRPPKPKKHFRLQQQPQQHQQLNKGLRYTSKYQVSSPSAVGAAYVSERSWRYDRAPAGNAWESLNSSSSNSGSSSGSSSTITSITYVEPESSLIVYIHRQQSKGLIDSTCTAIFSWTLNGLVASIFTKSLWGGSGTYPATPGLPVVNRVRLESGDVCRTARTTDAQQWTHCCGGGGEPDSC